MEQRRVRYAWIPLVLINLLIFVIVGSGEEGPFGEGSLLHAFLATNPTETMIEARLRGTLLLGMIMFGLAVILVPFRRGERWAWYVLWYYPLFFILHIVAFGTFIPDAILAVICTACLLAPLRVFFPQYQTAPGT